ncbi:hypothetical protein DFH94DRAFT_683168 [Russula ochroleuca]|uniref:Retroviral polymerase SH3-like domain-containing protein n=1 Tax=Russula ochroleuca TaxID=152965 RepID=A0A9P5MT45_9AGAM|nr:hypothetical protein DFH94DRAFT_683168 [Russula ochroleuca]
MSHLRPFGTHCTLHILSNTLAKFDPHRESGHFLGYAKDVKGYLIWVPGPNNCGGTVKTCQDVIFHDFPPTPAVAPVNNDWSPLWDDVTVPTGPATQSTIDYNDDAVQPPNGELHESTPHQTMCLANIIELYVPKRRND